MSFQSGQRVNYYPMHRGTGLHIVSATVVRVQPDPAWIVIRKDGDAVPVTVKATSIGPRRESSEVS